VKYALKLICVSWMLLTSALLAQAQKSSGAVQQQTTPAGEQPPTLDTGTHLNPLKVAELKWYKSNTSTQFPVGSQPYGLCFDGANIWSANFGDDTVSKIQANDGTVLGTFKVGNEPFGVTFDGANVWVSNLADSTVSKLRAQDGANLGTFAVGKGVSWMAFDGQNIWAASSVGTVTKLRASDGKNLGTFTVAFGAFGAAFDGQSIWITNGGAATVSKLRASDGTLLGTFAVGNGPVGIAFDGTNMWIANRGDGTVTELRARDGSVLGTFTAPDGHMELHSMEPISGSQATFLLRSSAPRTANWWGSGKSTRRLESPLMGRTFGSRIQTQMAF
jgi:hypothetical protein